MITKRIDRFWINLPDDWNDGYENVIIGCTVENMDGKVYRIKRKYQHSQAQKAGINT